MNPRDPFALEEVGAVGATRKIWTIAVFFWTVCAAAIVGACWVGLILL